VIGAIAGDIIGSVYEASPIKCTDFPLFSPASQFTDDTVLTIAVAAAILDDRPYGEVLRDFGLRYPDAGYGGSFLTWLFTPDAGPYASWGNGSAMRVSPVGFAYADEVSVLEQAGRSAAVSHDHPEGIKGAQAVALAVFLGRRGATKDSLRVTLVRRFGYDLRRTVDEIRPTYLFDVSCQGSVPEAIVALLDSAKWESAVRNAVSLEGGSDAMAYIAGAFYRVCRPLSVTKSRGAYTASRDVIRIDHSRP
jgi:ADP-ribosylglycohydrolase